MKAIEINFVNHYRGDTKQIGIVTKKVDEDIYHNYKIHKTFIGAIVTALWWYYVKYRNEKRLPELKKKVEAVVMPTILKEEISSVLSDCKTKLQLYRVNINGMYLGGREYTQLIKAIDDIFEKLQA